MKAYATYVRARQLAAKASISSALGALEDGIHKARRALDADEVVFTSFLACVPSLIEAAAKHTVYIEILNILTDDESST